MRAAGGTYYVGSTDGANSVTTGCADAANTTCTLRGAVAQNGTDDGGGTVRFSSMFPATPTSITLPGEQTITKNLMIDGTGHRVTINGGGSGFDTRRLFTVNGGVTFAVTGITLTGGNLNGGNRGGAIFNSGTLTVTDSTISGNSAITGYGGGIYNNYGTVTLTNSTLSNNSAPGANGGGIANVGGTLTVTNSTLSGNSARPGNGGGIYNDATGMASLTNSTVSGNSASLNGGGIYNLRGMVTLRNSTISGNSAPLEGGGIWNFGTVNAANTLIVNNGTSPYGEVSPYGIGTNIRNLTGPFAFANGETTPQDHGGPTRTLAIPTPTTPTATDAYQRGDLATCNAIPPDGTPGGIYDGRGAPRVVGGTCSIGAYEPGLVTTATTVTANSTGGPFGTSVTFTATVRGVRGDVPPDSTATVTFTNGTTALGTANLTGGTGTYTTATLPPGNSDTAGGAGNPYASSPPRTR